jgi:hypothetical protein
MSNYIKATNFASKDALTTGNPLKTVSGTEIDDEFTNIATAITTKANTSSPALTGTPTAPTAASGNSSTQVATTAFVAAASPAMGINTVIIDAATGATGKDIYINDNAPASEGNIGDIWFEY